MAYTSTEDYYNRYKTLNKADKDKALEDLKAQGVANEALIKEKAAEALETAEKTFTEKAMSAEEEAGLLREKNAINRALNERYINERMANLGLSNSGYAKASMMGAEAGYQNTAKGITEAEQKTLDTLAAALRESKTETEDWRKQQIEKNTADIDAEALKLENQYEENAEKYASDMVKQGNNLKVSQIDLEDKLNKKNEYGESYYDDAQKKSIVEKFIIENIDRPGLIEYLENLDGGKYEKLYYQGWGPQQWRDYIDGLQAEGMRRSALENRISKLILNGILSGENLTEARKAAGLRH